MVKSIPQEVKEVADALKKGGFEAHLVGGCVRDLLLGREPKDWDIATNAKPEEIQGLFEDSVYENEFGTVGVKTDSEDVKLKVVEVTTYRREGRYTDKRHPDEVRFAETIEEDLARRDFTVNAMAFRCDANVTRIHANDAKIVDPYDGQKDLKAKIIRTVGDPAERFSEDALRLVRAVRFAAELEFEIEEQTAGAIAATSGALKHIAVERIRDEFIKIIMSDCSDTNDANGTRMIRKGVFQTGAAYGVQMLEDLNLLRHIIPELREGIGCGQNLHHIYSVWEHNLRALDYAAENDFPLHIRLGALLHDVGKPATKRGEGKYSTFYGHEVVGAKQTRKIVDRLRFSKEIADAVVHLVRHHLFYYNVGEVTEAGVRRFLSRVGVENIDDLVKIRESDRIGSGVPKAKPYKIRHLLFMIDKVRRDPISSKMLKIGGDEVMKILEIPPGPIVGWILSALMDEVLEDPSRNTNEYLSKRVEELGELSAQALRTLAKKGEERMSEEESGAEREMKKKHHV